MAKGKRKTPGLNGSSSADIAFMLLIFFLITTSMDTDKGLKRRLPPLSPKQQKDKPLEIHDRNIMRLLVDRLNRIAISRKVNGVDQIQIVPLDKLESLVVEFITNPNNNPNLPEKEERVLPLLGKRECVTSGYAISLKNEVQTSYQMFINVQNELIKAYKEVWNNYARQNFGVSFDACSPMQQKAVTEAYPMHISEMPLSNLAKEK